MELPICRWRGEVNANGRYPCSSELLVVSPDGVPAEICAKCPIYNHGPVVRSGILTHESPVIANMPRGTNTAAGEPDPQKRKTVFWRFAGQLYSYVEAKARWMAAGCPVTPPAELAKREAACAICPQHDPAKDSCRVCGCGETWGSLAEKRGMATEACPADPPRW